MKHPKLISTILAGAILLSGCAETTDEISRNSTEISVESTTIAESSSSTESSVESTVESTSSTTESFPMESVPTVNPNVLTNLGEIVDEHPKGEIEICSVSQALSRFNEISASVPDGTPEEIVKTLMERNVLCFSVMYRKCWTRDEGEIIKGQNWARYAPMKSGYITSVEQVKRLFSGTYTWQESYLLMNPFGDDTIIDMDGRLYFDVSQSWRIHAESFSEPTRAAIVSATDDEITFGRVGGTNNFLFKAVKQNSRWGLENLVMDAPAYSPMYTKLLPTKRAGNPKFMEMVETQVGAVGGMKYCEWYGIVGRTEWCAIFVSWAYNEVDADGPVFARCDSEGRRWFTNKGRWQPRGYEDIAPGDSIFFDWDHDDSADHVGFVVGRDEEYVYTVEGNRSDTCIANKYNLDCPEILGYGLMEW